MPDSADNSSDIAMQRQKALARWDSEGGAGPDGPQFVDLSGDLTEAGPRSGPAVPNPGAAGIDHLHARVIALENMVIALLAGASDGQVELARDMAACISPGPDITRHPLTVHAARHMLGMIKRAEHFRATPSA